MGVVHKLREDIVSFIITLKKNNPAIGVRQIANLTGRQFHLKVSKSSVNSVLKKASLSSSVGRRPGISLRMEKFSIPEIKKIQISKSLGAVEFLKEEKSSLEKEREKEAFVQKKKPEELIEDQKEKQISLSLDSVRDEYPLPEELISEKKEEFGSVVKEIPVEQDFFLCVEEARREKETRGIPITDGAGFIFLKAAQWEISDKPLMAELLKKYIPADVSGRFDSISDMFLYFKFLEVESFDRISDYRDNGLWVLNNFGNPCKYEKENMASLQKLFEWDKSSEKNSSRENLEIEYRRMKEQSFLEMKAFKLWLEDNSQVMLDIALSSFGGTSVGYSFSYGTAPVQKTLARLSNCLVSNIQNAIFYRVPGETRFERAFYDMVSVFENVPGKNILKISVVDGQEEVIAEFSTIPSQKRTFLVGVAPEQKEFSELTKAVKWAGKTPFYHAGTDRVVYFTETKTSFIADQVHEGIRDFRVIAVWKEGESSPCWGILTNQQKGKGEDILKEYMSQWPYLGGFLQLESGGAVFGSEQRQIQKKDFNVFFDFVASLHGYCQKHFFPQSFSNMDITRMIADIYRVPGVYYAGKDTLSVFLNAEQGSVHYKDLQYAVKRVNESHILDRSGRRLWLSI